MRVIAALMLNPEVRGLLRRTINVKTSHQFNKQADTLKRCCGRRWSLRNGRRIHCWSFLINALSVNILSALYTTTLGFIATPANRAWLPHSIADHGVLPDDLQHAASRNVPLSLSEIILIIASGHNLDAMNAACFICRQDRV